MLRLVAIQQSAPYGATFGFAPAAAPDDRVAAKLASDGDGAQLMRANTGESG